MIKKLGLFLFCIGALMMHSEAYAGNVWASDVSVSKILVDGDTVLVYLPNNNAPTCNDGNILYMTAGEGGVTSAGRDMMFSMLVTAINTQKTVTIKYDDAVPRCVVRYVPYP